MKKTAALVLSILMSLLMAGTAFAGIGSWQYDGYGWKWRRSNGSVARNQWLWIDGNGDGWAECYCFDNDGYMLSGCYYDYSLINNEGKWVDDYGTPYLSETADEWTARETQQVSYPTGTFRFNTEIVNSYVTIERSGGNYNCTFELDGYDEAGNYMYRYLSPCPMYSDGYNAFAATDSYGDTLTFSYYGGDQLYNVSYNGEWGENYYKY